MRLTPDSPPLDDIHYLIVLSRLPAERSSEVTGKTAAALVGLNRKLAVDDAKRTRYPDYDRPPPGPARFKPGDRVRTRNLNPLTHTRLPRYALDKTGTIEAIRGCHVFPDSAAIGAGDNPQWLYTVVFSARVLWGEDADPTVSVSIEAFEPYLLAA
jgi:nitrile hydratase